MQQIMYTRPYTKLSIWKLYTILEKLKRSWHLEFNGVTNMITKLERIIRFCYQYPSFTLYRAIIRNNNVIKYTYLLSKFILDIIAHTTFTGYITFFYSYYFVFLSLLEN